MKVALTMKKIAPPASHSLSHRAGRSAPTILDIAFRRYETLASLIGSEKKFLGASKKTDRRSDAQTSRWPQDVFLLAPSPDNVHDIRVAARRLTQAARLLTPLMDKTSAAAVTDTLRDLRRSAGELRDLDVMHEHFEKWQLPKALHIVIHPLTEAYPRRRGKLLSELQTLLASVIMTTTMNLLDRMIRQHQQKDRAETLAELHDELCAAAKKRYRQFDQALLRAAQKQTPTAFHKARIAAKKLRYVLELADESGTPALKDQLKFLKTMQSDLGDMHDADVILEKLEDTIKKHPSPAVDRAWDDFRKRIKSDQAQRACRFFQASYHWNNDEQRHQLGPFE